MLRPQIKAASFKAQERIFSHGDAGDQMFIIRKGIVKILLPLEGGGGHHLASFGKGDFFGDVTFLDNQRRSADAISETETDIFSISRTDFNMIAEREPQISGHVFCRLAHILATRLRRSDAEIRDLKQS